MLITTLFGYFFFKSNYTAHYLYGERTDLLICVNAARRLWQGQEVYPLAALWAHTKPPFATLLFIPLGFLNEQVLVALWDLLNLSVVFALGATFSRELKKSFSTLDAWYSTLVAVFLITNFWGYELRFGQYNLLGLGLLWMAGRYRSAKWSGPLFWTAFFLKPSNLLLLPWILHERKNFKVFVLSSLTALAIYCLTYAAFFGPSQIISDHLQWLKFMKVAIDRYLMREVNYGLPLFIGYLTLDSWPQHLLLMGTLGFAFYWAKLKKASLHVFGVLAALSIMVSPMTWWATFTLLMPLSLYLIYEALRGLKDGERIRPLGLILVVFLGTQLIFRGFLPAPLSQYPRLANPNLIYLLYVLVETFFSSKRFERTGETL